MTQIALEYGVYAWREDGIYFRVAPLKKYKRRKDAERYAAISQKNYVVRTIDVLIYEAGTIRKVGEADRTDK